MDREIVVGLHFYQPPRNATHPLLSEISTDPQRVNWTEVIEKQCYTPLAEEGVLEKISFDIYQSLLIQLEKINPATADLYKKSMKENGVGEAFIHPILPDLSLIDKKIVTEAGVNRFVQITGVHPKIFWPPETAIDSETLEVLTDCGYEGFICAPEQISQSDGSMSDNKPTLINLKSGRQITAFPFDRSISSELAFNQKTNADQFANNFVKHKNENCQTNDTLIAWTDAETFGHHFHNGDKFINYLLKSSLPNLGIYPVSINSLIRDKSKLQTGTIQQRSAWSCPHGNLIRWNGVCQCSSEEDVSWKEPFSLSMSFLNDQVSKILQSELGKQYPARVASEFYTTQSEPKLINSPQKCLIAAKTSSLIAKTSCATFFSSPEVSGKINLLYAYQALLYLNESGLNKTTNNLRKEFFEKLSRINFPNQKDSALTVLEKMLTC